MRSNFYIALNEDELGELAQIDGEALAAYLFAKRNASFETAETRVISYGAFAAYRGYGENAREKAKRQILKLVKLGLLEVTDRKQVFRLPHANLRTAWPEPTKKCDRNNSNSTQNTTSTTYSASKSHSSNERKTTNKPLAAVPNPPTPEVQALMDSLKERLTARNWIYAADESEQNQRFFQSAAEWFIRLNKSPAEIEIIIDLAQYGKPSGEARVLDLCLFQNKWKEPTGAPF